MNNTPECTLGLVKPRYTPSKKHSEYSVSIQNPSDKLLNLGPESPLSFDKSCGELYQPLGHY